MMALVKLFCFIIFSSITCYSHTITPASTKADTLTEQIDQIMSEWNRPESPGAAIGVVKDGKLVFAKGYGSANLEYDIPITPTSVFHMASVSKQFTAYAIVLLAQQGKLDLNDDIRKYIPEVPDFGKTITIKHLLHHNSGLRDQWELLIMAGWGLDDVITKNDILRLVARQKELNFNPGDEHLYCNTGYTLLAEIVSRITGKSFSEWTKENMFEPLGMTNTVFFDNIEKIVKNRTYSYQPDEKGFRKSVLNYSNVGATSLFTNVNDMAKWVNNFYDPVVGDTETIKMMEEKGVLNNGDTLSYAFGQVLVDYKGVDMIIHDGGDAGFRTTLARFPGSKTAVMVFSNLASFDMHNTALKIADIVLGLEPGPEFPQAEIKKDTTQVVVESNILKDYEGTYELQPGFEIAVTVEDNNLMVQATGQPKFQAFASSETEFFLKVVDARLSFIRTENKKVSQFILHQNGQDMPCSRIDISKREAVNLDEYKGEYYSDELETTYIVEVINNNLTFKNVHIDDVSTVPAGKDKFLFGGFINFIFGRDSMNKVNNVRISTGRCRNVLFTKR